MTVECCPPSAWNRVRHRVEYALCILEQDIGTLQVMALPRREVKACRIAQRINRGLELGAQTAPAAPEGLFFWSPLHQGAHDAKVTKARRQVTPRNAGSVTVGTASMNNRLSRAFAPGRPTWPGSKSLMRSIGHRQGHIFWSCHFTKVRAFGLQVQGVID